MRISLVEGDITRQRVDAVVNAANSSLLGGGGVDGAIHGAAGPDLDAECRRLRAERYPDGLPVGQAVATTGGLLPARWVIHTVGPTWRRGVDRSASLRDCYTNSLAVAADLGARSVAFPLISAGIFGWPEDDAVRQAIAGMRATAGTGPDDLRLVLYGADTYQVALRVWQDATR